MRERLNVRTTADDEDLIDRLARDMGVSDGRPAERSYVALKAIWEMGERRGYVANGRLIPDWRENATGGANAKN